MHKKAALKIPSITGNMQRPLSSLFTGCYGVKPDSVGKSWMCSRCTKGAWIVVSKTSQLNLD